MLKKEELKVIWKDLVEDIVGNFEEFVFLLSEIGMIEFWEKEECYKFVDIYIYGFNMICKGII